MPRLTFPELRDRVIKHVATQGKVARIVGASELGKTRLVHAVIGGEHSLQDHAARESVLLATWQYMRTSFFRPFRRSLRVAARRS